MQVGAQIEAVLVTAIRATWRFTLLAIFFSCVSACSPKDAAQENATQKNIPLIKASSSERYVYLISCDGEVNKLDTATGSRVYGFLLADRTELAPRLSGAREGLDGCIAENILHEASAKQVHIIVPTTTREDGEGKRNFRWLTFALPDWNLIGSKPAGDKLESAPIFVRDANATSGAISVKRAADQAYPTEIDLSGYQGNGDIAITNILGNTIRQRSGDAALLVLHTGDAKRFRLGLADLKQRTLTLIVDRAATEAFDFHLAPGGGFVLIQTLLVDDKSTRRPGALSLVDSNGKVVTDIANAGISDHEFVTLTPNGFAVYVNNLGYRFIAIAPKNTRFGSAVVTRPFEVSRPAVVFSDE